MDTKKKQQENVEKYIAEKVCEYSAFMGIQDDFFSNCQIRIGNPPQEKVNCSGSIALAETKYQSTHGVCSLTIFPQIVDGKADFLLYHEFTHLLDDKNYCSRNPQKDFKIGGYSEYHAAQVDLLKLLGAKSVDEKVEFSMSDQQEIFGEWRSVRAYMLQSYLCAQSKIARMDDRPSFKCLDRTLGMLFNYWGRRSICKMYATDYSEEMDGVSLDLFKNYFSECGLRPIDEWDNLSNGFLEKSERNQMFELYYKVINYYCNNDNDTTSNCIDDG